MHKIWSSSRALCGACRGVERWNRSTKWYSFSTL